MTRLPPLLLPRHPLALAGMTAAAVSAALRVAVIPLFVPPLFDRVFAAGDLDALPALLRLGAGLALAMSLALLLQDGLLGSAAARLSAGWRDRLYRALLQRRPGTLPGTSGGLSGRILTDLKDVETYLQYGLGTLVAESLTGLFIVALLMRRDAGATALLLALGLPLVGVLALLGRRLARAAERTQAGTEHVGAQLQEGLRHHPVLRAFAADGFALRRFSVANRATRIANARRGWWAALQVPVAQLLVFAAMAGLIAILARNVSLGRLTVGQVVEYLTLVALLSTPSQLLPKGYALLLQARTARRRLLNLLDDPEADTPPAAVAPTARSGAPALALRGVDFRYADGHEVLKGGSVELPDRGLVALVGESGAGKSTLLQLLLRFRSPTAGTIGWRGLPLEALAEPELRRRIGYVPQGADLLSGTLRDNLTLGREPSETAIWEALEAVGLAETVRALPAGLDHALGEDGGGLSGGERQRIAVARALLGEPELLLLDEPSANLDAGSERALVATLVRAATRRLVLVVAHRPALIAAADLVLELRAGRLTVQRPHLTDPAAAR